MKRLAAILVGSVFLFTVFPSGGAVAGPLHDIQLAFAEGEYEAAYQLARSLAEKGQPKAQNILGYMYQSGQGVGMDYAEALKWYRKAALQGDEEALNNIGVMYENGLGVGLDYAEAVKWYRDAAAHGSPVAQNNLGVMFAYGKGVEQDYVMAYIWFDLAASTYPPWDLDRREQAVGNRDHAAYMLTPGQLAEAQRTAGELKRKRKADR